MTLSPETSSILQGILQGITEFLPVSSSAHLAVFQHVTGFSEPALAFDLVLHAATVCATLIYFYRDILRFAGEFFSGFLSSSLPKKEGWHIGWAVIAGSVPTALIGLFLSPMVHRFGLSMLFVGMALMTTSVLLMLLMLLPEGRKKVTFPIGLIVGIAQGIAVFPGLSRSGLTLTAGILCGLAADEAFRFSFLLSLPAIVGASLLELLKASPAGAVLPPGWLPAAAAAFLSGLAALFVLRRVVVGRRWWAFSLYCALAGSFAVFYL